MASSNRSVRVIQKTLFDDIALNASTTASLMEKGFAVQDFRSKQSIPASVVINELGLGGKWIGSVGILETDPNCLVSRSENPSAEDIAMLISYLKQQVRDAYGIQLVEMKQKD